MLEPSLAKAYDQARGISTRPLRAVCYSPFNSMFFDTLGHVRACCLNQQYTLGDLKTQRLDEIWNGPRANRLRQAMKNYDLRLGCQQCQGAIENGNFTNEKPSLSSVHAFKYDAFAIVENDGRAPWPTNLEFNLSNVCNLECVMCNGDLSSLIRSKRDHLPPLPHAYGDVFFADLDPYLVRLKSAQFLGGEPFLIQEHFRVWERLAQVSHMDWVGIVTNGTVYNEKVERVLDSLPVSLAMSIDGATKKTFESIRVNARFEVFMENCEKFLKYHRAHKRAMSFNWTLSRLNYHEFADFLLFADARECDVCICTLMDPERFSLYRLDYPTLRGIVDELERRDAEMERSLKRIKHVWHNALNNLRGELLHHRSQSAMKPLVDAPATPVMPVTPLTLPTAAAPADPAAPARLADRLTSARALSPAEEERQRDQAIAVLGGQGILELLTDRNDVITNVVTTDDAFVTRDAVLVGRGLDDLRSHLAGELGRNWDVSEGQRRDDRVDWDIRIGDESHAPTRLRTILLPRFGQDGRLLGLRVLLARPTVGAIG